MGEIELKDIANELLIINKVTIERILKFENPADCLALYVFYYSTAKWQKTNIVKATDKYVQEKLGWGLIRVRKTKEILTQNGLIEIVQRRTQGKIQGWYIKVAYMVSEQKIEENKVQIIETTNNENQMCSEPHVQNCTCGCQDTYAYNNNIYAYNNNIYASQDEEDKESEEELQKNFELIWKEYPRKDGKARAFEGYKQWLRGKKIGKKRIKLDNYEMWEATKRYAELVEKEKREEKYIKMGSTFFTSTILDYIEEN